MPVRVRLSLAGRTDGPGNAEIRDDRMAVREQDVLGLDVAVEHAEAVRIRERVSDRRGDLERALRSHWLAVAEQLPQ